MTVPQPRIASKKSRHPTWLLAGFWICVLIAMAVVVRRLIALAHPAIGRNSPTAALDTTFASHSALTIAHIVPAAIFVLLSVIVLLRPNQNRRMERAFFVFGLITGLTAYAMSAYAVGGWIERSAVFTFDSWFLYCLVRALETRKREWTTRAVGILLGIATTRPVMGVFFATSPMTHLTTAQFFGIAFWIGFSINAVVIELWLRSKARARMQNVSAV